MPPASHHVGEQVAVALKQGIKAGSDQIQIQLRPEELGRIEVKLDMAQDGRVAAVITADRAETLTLLRDDARGLEQSLRDAGLKADSGSLSFNLRGEQRFSDRPSDRPGRTGEPGRGNDRGRDATAVASATAAPVRGRRHLGALDIRI
jgi:flagellar hook-length control protein FliK